MSTDLAGKVFLITGATEGIGKAAARAFAARGATLVLVGRNPEKTERVRSELAAATGSAQIEVLLGDLSCLPDVRAIAQAFRLRHGRLDVLVNNAGAVFSGFQSSPDGFELTFAVNHLAYFQLTTALLDLLRATPGARVVSTASGAHYAGQLELPNVANPRRRRAGFRAYADSKLANILFTRELARRLEGSGATANCFHPGYIRSGLALNNGAAVQHLARTLAALFAKSPEHGADTLIWLATSPEAAHFNGEYLYRRRPARRSARARDDRLALALWEASEAWLAQTAAAPPAHAD
jgi:retinol dehydrogenase 12